MNISQIKINSYSDPVSIKHDFSTLQRSLSLEMSLEISVDSEEVILKSVCEELQLFLHIEELYIIVSKQCILQQFNILLEAFDKLNNLKVFSITFQSQCFTGQSTFKDLCSALKNMNLLTDLRVYVEDCNQFNKDVCALFSHSLKHLFGLLKLKISISVGNQFDDEKAIELVEGFNHLAHLQELELSFDSTYITCEGMNAIGNSLKCLSKTLVSLKLTFLGKQKYLKGVSQIFGVLPSLCELKILKVESEIELNLDQQEIENILNFLTQLTHLESISLKQIIDQKYVGQSLELIKSFSNFNSLKSLDLELLNSNEVTYKDSELLSNTFFSLSRIQELNLLLKDSESFENNCVYSLSNSFLQMTQLTTFQLQCQTQIGKYLSFHLMESVKNLVNLQTLKFDLGPKVYTDKEVLYQFRESIKALLDLRQLSLILQNKRANFDMGDLDLSNLKNLEELIIKNVNEFGKYVKFKNKDILPNLKGLVKLRRLELRCFLNQKTVKAFQKEFTDQGLLTDLSLCIQQVLPYKIFNSKIFKSLSSLKNLQNLEIESDDVCKYEQQSKSLGRALLQLSNLTNFKLRSSTFVNYDCLQYILNGFSNSHLKELTIAFSYVNQFQIVKDIELFKHVQQIESLCIEGMMDDIIINQLKYLKKLQKLTLLLKAELYIENKKLQNIINSLNSLPYLLDISLKYILRYDDLQASKIYNLFEGSKLPQQIRNVELDFYYFPQQVQKQLSSFTFLKQLQNIRSLSLISQIQTDVPYLQLPKRLLLNELPKYLTKLEFSLASSKCFDFQAHNWLADEFRTIRSFKYLTDLSVKLCQLNGLHSTEVMSLGYSLQEIESIQNLNLNFNLLEDCTYETISELSKGIQAQKNLERLSIEIFYNFQIIGRYYYLISLMESLRSLQFLTHLTLSFGLSKQSELIKLWYNEELIALSKSISSMQNLRELNLSIYNRAKDYLEQGLISMADSFRANASLISLRLFINQAEIGDTAAQAFGEGLSFLEQLEECSIILLDSNLNDTSGLLSGINSLHNLKSFGLNCNVKQFSFTPFDELVSFHKKGKISICQNFKQQEQFDIDFKSPQLNISMIQKCKNQTEVRDYQELMEFLGKLPLSIQIDFDFQHLRFLNSDEHDLFLKWLTLIQSFNLKLLINSDWNLFQMKGISQSRKIQEIKELKLDCRKYSKQIDDINFLINFTSNLNSNVTNILSLDLILSPFSYQQYSQQKVMMFINEIIKFKQLVKLHLTLYFTNQITYQTLQRKLKFLAQLKVKQYSQDFYVYRNEKQKQLPYEEYQEEEEDEINGVQDSLEENDIDQKDNILIQGQDILESYSEIDDDGNYWYGQRFFDLNQEYWFLEEFKSDTSEIGYEERENLNKSDEEQS